MVNAVIFDMDGLLVNTEIVSYQILKEILAQFGHELSLEEYTREYSGKPETANAARLVETCRLPWTPEEALERIFARERQLLARGVALKPGAGELLQELKKRGCKTAVASSSTTERGLGILEQHQIRGCFDQTVFAEDIQRGKPNPDVFLKACEKLGERPERCLVLEDSEAGIQAAHAAHIPVICVPDLKQPDQRFLDMTAAVLSSLDQVISYLTNQKG